MAKKYKLLWPKRVEKGMVLTFGTVTDLSHYTPEQIERLLAEGQYEEVAETKKAVKDG